MDFSPDEGQQAVADVVTSVLERDNSWDALVAGGVTALGVPERAGGDGVGLPELATALTEIGRHGTTGPALSVIGATAVLADLASEAQQDRFLADLSKGSIVTLALNEPGSALPDKPAATLAGGKLNGTKIGVPYAAQAEWIVVTADNGVVVLSAQSRRCSGHADADVQSLRRVRGDVLRCRRRRRRRVGRCAGEAGQPVGARGHRRIRGRSRCRCAAADRRLCRQPRAVRQAAVDFPDSRRSVGRGLHRLAHTDIGRRHRWCGGSPRVATQTKISTCSATGWPRRRHR